jgi:serine/threonine protein kinase
MTQPLVALHPVEAVVARRGHRVGPFHLKKQLGAGGFAPVYLAAETYGDQVLRNVALKLFVLPKMTDALASDRRIQESLVQEARALCKVEHPNVVRFFQIVEDPDARLLGIAMELVRGTSVASTLTSLGKLPVPRVLDIGIAVASALSAVHHAGLVHRDVKPDNVVETDDGYKLIDFGIAVRDTPTSESSVPVLVAAPLLDGLAMDVTTDVSEVSGLTAQSRTLAGTMGYIDPESLRESIAATPASDLYALGAMLYECLANRLPASPGEAIYDRLVVDVMVGRAPAPPLASVAPWVPTALAELVDHLVRPARGARPRSADWVLSELERIRRAMSGVGGALPSEDEGPFRGLDCFEKRHRAVFLGRSTELASALETLRSNGLLSVVGASGSGKSSLARAAILPEIEEQGLGRWPPKWDTAVAMPGADARVAILAALRPFVVLPADEVDPGAVVQALLTRAEQQGRGLVLLIDQLEEIVTQGTLSGRRFAIELLASIAERPLPGLRAVVSIRRDLLDPLLAEEDLGRALGRGMLLVAPLSAPTWREIVSEGVRRYGYTVDDETTSAIVDELRGMDAAMPLVQFALAKLWERRDRAARTLPLRALAEIGGIRGALEMHAESLVSSIVSRRGGAALVAIERMTMVLTTPQGTRLSVGDRELLARVEHPLGPEVLSALEAARLVVRDGPTVAFTHDSVLVGWRRLADWIRRARADRELAAELEQQAGRWEARRLKELHWSGLRLGEARFLVQRGTVRLTPRAHAFVKASRSAELRRTAGGFGLVGAILVAGLLAFVLYEDSARRSAETRSEFQAVQADISQRRTLAIAELQKQLAAAKDERDACLAEKK